MGLYIFLHITNNNLLMSNFKQGTSHLSANELVRQNQKYNRELLHIKTQLLQLYEENIQLKEIIKQQDSDKIFLKQCQAQLHRLKNLMRQANQKRQSMPTERQEIKDRIIMKLQDELICTKIQLKEAQLEIARLTRNQ